ncbi:MAG TPA: hypothetical protein G4O18_04075 [Dehalococcoidia bacterium]|nr:hypothetical protein [Dehalococcoidia bacterium]
MGKEKNGEQEFLRDIDRFLNGEEVTPDEETGEDVRSAVEFAHKLTELRAEPSREFQESLKSRLLRKLTEQEMAARERAGAGWFSGFLDRVVPQSPVWRTAVVTVAIMVVAAGIMWQTGLFTMTSAPGEGAETAGDNDRGLVEMTSDDTQKDWSQNGMAAFGEEEEEEEEAFVSSPSEDGLSTLDSELEVLMEISSHDEITITIEPLTTQYGTEVTLTLTFRNSSSTAVTIDPIQPEIFVRGLDNELVYTLPAVDGPEELLPSESFQMIYIWNQQDNSGAQVPAGTYRFNIGSIIITCGANSGVIITPPAEVVILEQ